MKRIVFLWLMIGSFNVFGQDRDSSYYCNCKTNPDTLDGQPVYLTVNKMPSFPGGNEKLMSFITKNLIYPNEYRDNYLQTAIYITFIIDTTGVIRNVCVNQPRHKSYFTPFEREGLKMIDKMPKWIPGELEGKKVYVRVYLPIRVDLK